MRQLKQVWRMTRGTLTSGRNPLRTRLSACALIAALVLSVSACSWPRRLANGVGEDLGEARFYTVPADIPVAPAGTIYRTEKLLSAPSGTNAWRILYHSRDLNGADILVSGVVVTPTSAPPAGGRTIVSWAHPTTGAARKCAPSLGIDPFGTIEGLTTLLKAGYAVAATDYSGMGVRGPDSYLIGQTEGHNVLDAARAARQLLGARASNRVILWGHSQGGQAALFAGQSAASYAPELHVTGVAVAAPATNLGALLNDDIGDVSGVTISSYAFTAFTSVYGPTNPDVRLDAILTPDGAAATPKMAQLCLFGQSGTLHSLARPLIGRYLAADPSTTAPWSALLAANTPGTVPLPAPLFVAQGAADTLVRPKITKQFADHEKMLGTSVTYLSVPKTGHGLVALRAMPALMRWLQQLPA